MEKWKNNNKPMRRKGNFVAQKRLVEIKVEGKI
jgi:hypothetical protein